jgi:sugar diacid utilization regulator
VATEEHRRIAMRVDPDALAGRVDGLACRVVADVHAPGRRARLEAAAGGHLAACGPEVPWTQAPRSHGRARAVLALREQGIIAADGLLWAEEWLAELMLHADGELRDELRRARLGALMQADRRGRLAETLPAWLRHQGAVAAVAAELGVHRQTVRYRLGRLRELLDGQLDDPDARFELELALRAGTPGS